MKKLGIGLITLFVVTGMMMSCKENQKTEEKTTLEKESTELQQPEKSKKTVVARVFVKEGKEAAFLEITAPLIQATRLEEGNISYVLYQSVSDPKEFIFYEEYKDDAALKTHASSAHFATFADAIADMLSKDLIIEDY
jgi:quinol monooxygenase YgiN